MRCNLLCVTCIRYKLTVTQRLTRQRRYTMQPSNLKVLCAGPAKSVQADTHSKHVHGQVLQQVADVAQCTLKLKNGIRTQCGVVAVTGAADTQHVQMWAYRHNIQLGNRQYDIAGNLGLIYSSGIAQRGSMQKLQARRVYDCCMRDAYLATVSSQCLFASLIPAASQGPLKWCSTKASRASSWCCN